MTELPWRPVSLDAQLPRQLRLAWALADPRRFTRMCSAAAMLWLVAVVGGSLVYSPKVEDFGQYYMGGVMANAGLYDSLYPIPIADVHLNAGWGNASILPGPYAALLEERGVGDPARPIDSSTRFIQTPALALLLAWMGPLSHDAAFWCWVALMMLCTWWTAVLTGRFHDVLAGRATRTAGVLVLLVATSPLAARTIRSTNITPLVALSGAIVMWELLRAETVRGSVRGAIAMALGGFAKYTPASLFLPALLMRRWGLFTWTALIGFGFCGVTLLVMGREPWEQFLFTILPTLSHGSLYVGNQSLAGLVTRVSGVEALHPDAMRLVRAAGVAVLAVLAVLMVRSRHRLDSPPVLFAAGAAMTAWWAVSGPLYWEHYYLALCPFWPWLIWEARHGGWRTKAAVAAILLTWLPVIMLLRHGINLPEPLGSHMFFGAVLVLILAAARLRAAAAQSAGC
jgi:hypothetical protein